MSNEERTPCELPLAKLKANAWNTHSVRCDADFRGLCDSIRANGMMHRIVVRSVGDHYEIIDGHRRYQAAATLKMTTVPCDIVTATDTEAQAMTITANVQRLANDPLLEADVIQRLADAGKSYARIAAIVGADERTICRRARLCNLTDGWREFFGKAEADADIMEFVAAHERDLQDEVFAELKLADYDEDSKVDEDDIQIAFRSRLRKIDGTTAFDTVAAGCAKCPYNTATHGWLFPTEEDEDTKGRCQRAECYVRHWNEAVDAKIAALRAKKITVREVAAKWSIPGYWKTTETKTRTNTIPYVYVEDDLKRIKWAAKAATASAPAKTEAEKAEEKRLRKLHNEWSRNRRDGIAKIRDVLTSGDRAEKARLIVSQPAFADVMRERYEEMIGSWIPDSDIIDIGRILGFDAVGVTEEQAKALTHGDPSVEREANHD